MKIMTPNSSTGHQASEKFLVAVNQSPNAENLIRKGHEMASFHNAPWFAVHVSKSDDLSPDDRTALAENIHLARELGAEIIIIHDDDFAQAILKIAKEKKITQIVIGGPRHRKSRSLITKLITQSNGLCVHILDKANVFLKGHKQVIKDTILPPVRIFNSRPINYLYTIFLLIFVTLISALLNPYLEYRAVGYLYLMAVIAVGFSGTLGPILLSAIGGAFIWNFVFIPPRFTFHIHDPEDRMMCMTFIFAGVLSGFPARKTRKREKLLLLREHNTRNLYNLLNDFAKAMSVNEICDLAEKSVMDLMNSNIAIILSASERDLPNRTINSRSLSNQDFALAQLSFKHKKPAGWSTKIFSDSRCLSIPLIATQAIGVVLFYPPTLKMQLSLDEESLLNNICLQLATALEHLILQNQKQEIQLFKESEKLHQTLLNSVSHEMRIPLTSILGNINALQNEKVQSDPDKIKLLQQDLTLSCQRLNQVIENLLDMNRLNSGFLNLKKEWIEAHDLVKTVTGLIKNKDHLISIVEKSENSIVQCDVKLMEHALLNLLLNAKNYSAPNSEIQIEIDRAEDAVIFRVLDQGNGIPEDKLELIFNKFYRLPGSPTGGVGLGLSIVKGIAEAHNGFVKATNRPDQAGAIFEIQIPWHKAEMGFNEDLS